MKTRVLGGFAAALFALSLAAAPAFAEGMCAQGKTQSVSIPQPVATADQSTTTAKPDNG